MPKIMDPILPILSISGYWAIILGTSDVQVLNTPDPHRVQARDHTDAASTHVSGHSLPVGSSRAPSISSAFSFHGLGSQELPFWGIYLLVAEPSSYIEFGPVYLFLLECLASSASVSLF